MQHSKRCAVRCVGSIPTFATMRKIIVVENVNKNNPYEKWIIDITSNNVFIIHQGPELGRLNEYIDIKGDVKIT
jgi:deoxycytidine triphosphate deaminase